MAEPASGEITRLLISWSEGDEDALEKLVPLVYGDLRALAESRLRGERRDHTLSATAVVHEVYCRLSGIESVSFSALRQFFSLASQLMRRILVDHARARLSKKRGGGAARLPLDENTPVREEPLEEILAVHEALDRLESLDPVKKQVVELRYFGALTFPEIAIEMGVSRMTVIRHWNVARLWLHRELSQRNRPQDLESGLLAAES